MVLGAGLVLVLGRILWKEIANWQAARLAHLAAEYAKEGRLKEAAMSADTALRLNPVQPEALRFMAVLMEKESRWDQAMELYGRLYNSGGGRLDDLKKQALNAGRGGYKDPAIWLSAQVEAKGEPGFSRVMEAELLLKKGDVEGARTSMRRALEVSKGSRAIRAAMLRFLLAHPEDDGDREILQTLNFLKDGGDAEALEALTIGLATGVLPVENRMAFVKALRAHPFGNARSTFLADVSEVAADPSSRDRVAIGMVARVSGASLPERALAAQWLLAQGLPDQAASILPFREAKSSEATMKVWLDIQADLRQWNPMLAALAENDCPIPRHMAQVYSARALQRAGRTDEGQKSYESALRDNASDPGRMVEILGDLHRSGEYELFDQALALQLAKPDARHITLQKLVSVVQEARDANRMRSLISAALAVPEWRNSAPLLNDAAYLDLVLKRRVDREALRVRLRNSPMDPAVLSTLALERLQAGQKSEALALFEGTGLAGALLAPNQKVVLSCVLSANGRREEAVTVAAGIPATKISTQELELLREYLGP